MTMMITKFHRLIQSKILWGAFSVIISIAFVGLFTEIPMASSRQPTDSTLATLEGKPVNSQEFQQIYAATRVQVAISMGRDLPRTDAVNQQLREMAWKRLVSLRKARELGIEITEEEILQGIQEQPMFQNDQGQFDPRIYAVFLNRFLIQQLGINQHQFEAFIRDELVLQKLQSMVAESILISPAELNRAYRSVTDTFDLQLTRMSFDDVESVTATEEEARAYFEENQEAFRLPERAVVDYVAFSIQDAAAAVSVPTEEVEAYYRDNIDQYTIEPMDEPAEDLSAESDLTEGSDTNLNIALNATNEVPTLPELEAADLTPTNQFQPLEEVQEEIEAVLKRRKALLALGEEATDFVLAVQDAAYKDQTFQAVAEEEGYAVQTTEPFSRRSPVPGIDAGASFNRDAFDLGQSLETSFSDPITGENTIYVLSLVKKIPSEIPSFEEVKEDAVLMASQEATSERLVEKAEAFRDRAQQALDEGGSFSNVVAEAGLEMETLEEVSAAMGIPDHPNQDLILRGILSRNQGEISDILPTQEELLLIHVAERTPAPPQDFAAFRPRIVQNLIGERASRIFNGFQEFLLKEADFDLLDTMESEDPENEDPV